MLAIDLEAELETKLNYLAKKEQISLNEIIKKLVINYLEQNQDTGELLIDIVNNLPEITCFNHQDPLEIQKSLRDEWD